MISSSTKTIEVEEQFFSYLLTGTRLAVDSKHRHFNIQMSENMDEMMEVLSEIVRDDSTQSTGAGARTVQDELRIRDIMNDLMQTSGADQAISQPMVHQMNVNEYLFNENDQYLVSAEPDPNQTNYLTPDPMPHINDNEVNSGSNYMLKTIKDMEHIAISSPSPSGQPYSPDMVSVNGFAPHFSGFPSVSNEDYYHRNRCCSTSCLECHMRCNVDHTSSLSDSHGSEQRRRPPIPYHRTYTDPLPGGSKPTVGRPFSSHKGHRGKRNSLSTRAKQMLLEREECDEQQMKIDKIYKVNCLLNAIKRTRQSFVSQGIYIPPFVPDSDSSNSLPDLRTVHSNRPSNSGAINLSQFSIPLHLTTTFMPSHESSSVIAIPTEISHTIIPPQYSSGSSGNTRPDPQPDSPQQNQIWKDM